MKKGGGHTHVPGLQADQVPRSIRDELDQRFPIGKQFAVENLNEICEFSYGFMVDLWEQQIVSFLERLAETQAVAFRQAYSAGGPVSFLFDRTVYTCRVGTSMVDTRVICLNLSRASAVDVSAPLERAIKLDVSGRYREIRLYVDKTFDPVIDSIQQISHECLTAGDRWIESFVVSQLACIQEDPLAQLYAMIRRLFSTKIGRTIRLYLIDPEKGGGVFLDEEARKHTLGQLAGYAYASVEQSPAELLSGLMVARFAIEDTVAREIVPNMITVTKSALEIPSGTKVGLAQHVMYGGEGMVLQPLVALDKLWVETAYPVKLKSDIEPVLLAERDTFVQAVGSLKFHRVNDPAELSRGRRVARAEREGWAGSIAGIAGRFTGGFMSEYMN